MPTYNPKTIEERWQQYWEQNKTFRTVEEPDKKKFYVLDMFPYPSGSGLHVGHPEGYTATDILARYRRMQGDNVLHPMGWDAFGLPAEQHAIDTGEHPRINTKQNVDNFRRQIKMLGFSYDWDRECNTTDPNYYRWTQWIFLQLFDTWFDPETNKGRPISELPIPEEVKKEGEKAVRLYQDQHRLAFQSEVPVNWCPALGTVLANEEVIDGKSERGDHPVVRKPLRQWMLRITAYAERLLADIDDVDWPHGIKELQRNWIGKSTGAEVDFSIVDSGEKIRVYTTRPDTLFGATYMVLSPEHELVDQITTEEQKDAVQKYRDLAAQKSDMDRTELNKEKTGVFTGAYAINPVNDKKIPVWIADYVLMGYGTGAIMAVPAQDARDWEFAKKFDLDIIRTVQPPEDFGDEPYLEDGPAINSDFLNGLNVAEAKAKMIEHLEEKGLGEGKVNYKLRDWLFSRQRYWGEPFPILHELDDEGKPTGIIEPISEDELPLVAPEMEDYKPSTSDEPNPPLGKATEWVNVERDGKKYRRETNTMPQWAGSCWYYLRYLDPNNDKAFCDPEIEKHWMPVDLYVGGAEHAVLHLLYARFWHKVLYDRGHVSTAEPFQRLVNQGMILGETDYSVSEESYEMNRQRISSLGLETIRIEKEKSKGEETEKIITYALRKPAEDSDKLSTLDDDQVEKKKGKTYLKDTNIEIHGNAEKMSKSRGNVINPDDVVRDYGADSLRLYEMFMGPLEATKPWSMRGVDGVFRFLCRTWRVFMDERAEEMKLDESITSSEPDRDTARKLHQTIQKVTNDLDGMRFNTAISAMMELTNHLTKMKERPRSVLETFALLLAPFVPHFAEELWNTLGHEDTLAYEPWPSYDPEMTKEDEIEVPVQINGKVKAKLSLPPDLDEKAIEAQALADERVLGAIGDKKINKVIVVKRKTTLVNVILQK